MCPECHGQMVSGLDGNGRMMHLCLMCSFLTSENIPEQNNRVAQAPNIWSFQTAGLVPDARNGLRRLERFESLLSADDGVNHEACQEAKKNPGRWVVSTPIVERYQMFRAFLGLSWHLAEPQMAFRFDPATSRVEMAFADQISHQSLPTWRELFLNPHRWSVSRPDFN